MSTKKHTKLGEWFATAISGNDILSSCLYVSGIAITFAGIFAPLVLGFIGIILFFYKKVYTEVVEALPINGGAYNCLLNGTSKTVAAIAGIMTILSYVATAVLSGKIGIEYLHSVESFVPVIPTCYLRFKRFSKGSVYYICNPHFLFIVIFSIWNHIFYSGEFLLRRKSFTHMGNCFKPWRFADGSLSWVFRISSWNFWI